MCKLDRISIQYHIDFQKLLLLVKLLFNDISNRVRLLFFLLQLLNHMKRHQEDDGWQNHENQEEKLTIDTSNHFRYRFKQVARDILDTHHHSLQPDMVFGWRPKLPSCPLPLTYANTYTDALLAHLPNDDRFKLIYLGPRPSNSVQVNQQYDYSWKYRPRYNTNILAVKQAIKRVGDHGRRYNIDIAPNQIQFDSAFQSGNLDMAIRVKKNQYDLFLRSDTNTRGHTSWYYFKVNNKDLVGQVQFNLCNFGKKKNLYTNGLKPYEMTEGDQWRQQNCYEVNWVQRICRYGFDRKSFQLQFKYFFKQRNQCIYFAYSIPYTYSRLQNFISNINLKENRCIEHSKLCETLGGLDVPLLTITHKGEDQNSDSSNNGQEKQTKKKIMLITGRIHPGQPHSSFIVQGLVRFLSSDDPTSVILRKNFIFYVIPMLNPDGVITGNFRTSFSGKDLNRQFNKLNKHIFPEITALHDLAMQLKRNNRSAFQFYFDFHAHSSKKGLFCYGPQHTPGKTQYFKSRALAKLIEQKSPIFSYLRSIFTVSETKKSTGRAHMLWKIKIPMSFTFQVSNGLYDNKQSRHLPLYEKHLLELGFAIGQGFYRYGQLQMRLPTIRIKAKVDTGIKKRSGLSAKQFRKSTSKKGKTLTTKELNAMQLKDSCNTQHLIRERKQISLHQLNYDQQSINKYESSCDKQDFLKILQEIKRQENEQRIIDQYQGGSDSQSQADDLQEEEIKKLHKMIETRHENTKSYSKGFIQWKSKNPNQLQRKQSQSQQIKENFPTIQQDFPKKPITSKYMQSIKLAALPPRSKRLQLPQAQRIVLLARNFALQI